MPCFVKQQVFGPATNPPSPRAPIEACPATGFPCSDWLLSLVLAEVCLAAQDLTPHCYRKTSCTALTINTPAGSRPTNHPPEDSLPRSCFL